MNRERKLLYLAVVLAVLFEGMSLASLYLTKEQPSRAEAIREARDCTARLLRTYVACFGKGGPAKHVDLRLDRPPGSSSPRPFIKLTDGSDGNE